MVLKCHCASRKVNRKNLTWQQRKAVMLSTSRSRIQLNFKVIWSAFLLMEPCQSLLKCCENKLVRGFAGYILTEHIDGGGSLRRRYEHVFKGKFGSVAGCGSAWFRWRLLVIACQR